MRLDDKIRNKLLQVREGNPKFATVLDIPTLCWYYGHGAIEHQQWDKADEWAESAATDLWGPYWRPQAWPETPTYPRRRTVFDPKEGVKHGL